MGSTRKLVSNRPIEYDLRFLLAVLNWAVNARDEQGLTLLESNPTRGLKLPKEMNPTRVPHRPRNPVEEGSMAIRWLTAASPEAEKGSEQRLSAQGTLGCTLSIPG